MKTPPLELQNSDFSISMDLNDDNIPIRRRHTLRAMLSPNLLPVPLTYLTSGRSSSMIESFKPEVVAVVAKFPPI